MRAPRPDASRVALACVLLLQVVLGAAYIARTSFSAGDERVFVLWDDAMISMRYARNLAEGYGLVWNPGEEAVQGYTNLGVTLVMGALHLLPVAPERTSLLFQVFELGVLLASLAYAARFAHLLSARAWAGPAAALALVLCAPVQIYALQGADNGLASLALLAAIDSVVRAGRGAFPVAAFAWLGLGIAARPDGTLYYALALALAAAAGRESRRSLALGAAGLGAIWLALAGFSQSTYGDPLPNTWYLKATGAPFGVALEHGARQLAVWLPRWLPALALAAVVLVRRPRERAAQLAAACVAIAAAYHVWTGGDWLLTHGSRYLVFALPVLLALSAAGSALIADRVPARARPAIALAAAAGCALAIGPEAPLREWLDPTHPTLFAAENRGNYERARWLRRATTPDTSVAEHWAGVGPYFSERPSLDVLGRSDRHIARLPIRHFEPGHSKWDWDYVLEERRPDVISMTTRGLAEHPVFLRDYVIARLGPRAELYFRRDSLQKLRDPGVRILELR